MIESAFVTHMWYPSTFVSVAKSLDTRTTIDIPRISTNRRMSFLTTMMRVASARTSFMSAPVAVFAILAVRAMSSVMQPLRDITRRKSACAATLDIRAMPRVTPRPRASLRALL